MKSIEKFFKENIIPAEARFKDRHSFEKRHSEAQRVLTKYPNRIPIVCERFKRDDPDIDKKKYLVPNDLSVANFAYVIRKRVKMAPEHSLYFFINDSVMPPTSELMASLYEKHADEDGFLYMTYSGESTFG